MAGAYHFVHITEKQHCCIAVMLLFPPVYQAVFVKKQVIISGVLRVFCS